MAEKRKDITQAMCDQVKFLIKGGATNKKAGEFIGVSATTISRIRTAGYNAEEFRKNNEARREEEKLLAAPITESKVNAYFARREEEKKTGSYACGYTGVCELPESGIELTPDGPRMKGEQIPGQMAMELLPTQEQAKETTDLNKLLRFLAGKTDLLSNQLSKYDRYMREMGIELCGISTKLDKLNDNLCQILRRMDK